MKALTVKYERLYNLGDFSHQKIGIELQVEDGEKAQEVLEKAKLFCRLNSMEGRQELGAAREILANRQNEFVSRVEEAEKTIAEFEQQEDLPF